MAVYTESMRHVKFMLLPVLAGLVVLTGCSPAANDVSAYSSDIEAAKEAATSDFERDALADGEISRSDYEEAVNRYVECMETQSVTLSPEDQLGYFIFGTTADSNAYDSADTQCRPGTIALIEPLYVEMLQNPQKRPMGEIVAECLVEKGIADDGFSSEDFRKAIESKDPILQADGVDDCLANPSYRSDDG